MLSPVYTLVLLEFAEVWHLSRRCGKNKESSLRSCWDRRRFCLLHHSSQQHMLKIRLIELSSLLVLLLVCTCRTFFGCRSLHACSSEDEMMTNLIILIIEKLSPQYKRPSMIIMNGGVCDEHMGGDITCKNQCNSHQGRILKIYFSFFCSWIKMRQNLRKLMYFSFIFR